MGVGNSLGKGPRPYIAPSGPFLERLDAAALAMADF